MDIKTKQNKMQNVAAELEAKRDKLQTASGELKAKMSKLQSVGGELQSQQMKLSSASSELKTQRLEAPFRAKADKTEQKGSSMASTHQQGLVGRTHATSSCCRTWRASLVWTAGGGAHQLDFAKPHRGLDCHEILIFRNLKSWFIQMKILIFRPEILI